MEIEQHEYLTDLLIEEGMITTAQAGEIAEERQRTGKVLQDILIESDYVRKQGSSLTENIGSSLVFV